MDVFVWLFVVTIYARQDLSRYTYYCNKQVRKNLSGINNKNNVMKKLIYLLLILFLQNLSHVEAQYSWNQKSDFIGFDRVFMAGFSTQNKGYVGGGVENQIGTPHKEFYEWSQQTNTWSQKADIPIPVYMGVAFSINGIGYLGSGATTGGTRITKFWKYTPSNDTWDTIADLPGVGRVWAVAFSIGGFGYVGLGSSGNYGTKSFWKYDPVNNVWTSIADFGGSGRDKAVAFVIDSEAYVGTGQDSLVAGFRNDFWKYSPTTDSWTQVSSINTPRRNATAFSILGKGYVGTGNCICQPIRLKDFWEYNPTSNQWVQIADCSSEIRQYAPAYSINNRGYVLTGVDTNGMVLNDNWEYGPPTLPLSANATPTNPSCNSLCDGTATADRHINICGLQIMIPQLQPVDFAQERT